MWDEMGQKNASHCEEDTSQWLVLLRYAQDGALRGIGLGLLRCDV